MPIGLKFITDYKEVLPIMNKQNAQRSVAVSADVATRISPLVLAGLADRSDQRRVYFMDEFRRKSKSLFVAYITSLLFLHYLYLGRPATTAIMWGVSILTLGFFGVVWWFIDLFRMPGMVKNYNQTLSLSILQSHDAVTDPN